MSYVLAARARFQGSIQCVQFLEGFRGYAFMGKVGAIAQADTCSAFLWCLGIPPSEDDSVYTIVQSGERGAGFHHQKIKQRKFAITNIPELSQFVLTIVPLLSFRCPTSLPSGGDSRRLFALTLNRGTRTPSVVPSPSEQLEYYNCIGWRRNIVRSSRKLRR